MRYLSQKDKPDDVNQTAAPADRQTDRQSDIHNRPATVNIYIKEQVKQASASLTQNPRCSPAEWKNTITNQLLAMQSQEKNTDSTSSDLRLVMIIVDIRGTKAI